MRSILLAALFSAATLMQMSCGSEATASTQESSTQTSTNTNENAAPAQPVSSASNEVATVDAQGTEVAMATTTDEGTAVASTDNNQPTTVASTPTTQPTATTTETVSSTPSTTPAQQPVSNQPTPAPAPKPNPKAPVPTPTPDVPLETRPQKPALSHDIWDGLMRKYVNSSGRVNYSGLKSEKSKVDEYLGILEANPPQSSWSDNKEMAYWINLYNAFTIQILLENYPVNSIMDVDAGKVWDKRKITIGSKSYTLNQIEKDMLIKKFNEPRVHFAVNCGAKSCPPLLNKAWTESNVQRYYESQAKAFINDSDFNKLGNKPQISKIFEWYAGDFGGAAGVVTFINKYADTAIKSNAKIGYLEYDWNLNKQ